MHRLITKISSSSLNRQNISIARRVCQDEGSKHLPSTHDLIQKRRAMDSNGYEFDCIEEEGFFFRPSDTLPLRDPPANTDRGWVDFYDDENILSDYVSGSNENQPPAASPSSNAKARTESTTSATHRPAYTSVGSSSSSGQFPSSPVIPLEVTAATALHSHPATLVSTILPSPNRQSTSAPRRSSHSRRSSVLNADSPRAVLPSASKSRRGSIVQPTRGSPPPEMSDERVPSSPRPPQDISSTAETSHQGSENRQTGGKLRTRGHLEVHTLKGLPLRIGSDDDRPRSNTDVAGSFGTEITWRYEYPSPATPQRLSSSTVEVPDLTRASTSESTDASSPNTPLSARFRGDDFTAVREAEVAAQRARHEKFIPHGDVKTPETEQRYEQRTDLTHSHRRGSTGFRQPGQNAHNPSPSPPETTEVPQLPEFNFSTPRWSVGTSESQSSPGLPDLDEAVSPSGPPARSPAQDQALGEHFAELSHATSDHSARTGDLAPPSSSGFSFTPQTMKGAKDKPEDKFEKQSVGGTENKPSQQRTRYGHRRERSVSESLHKPPLSLTRTVPKFVPGLDSIAGGLTPESCTPQSSRPTSQETNEVQAQPSTTVTQPAQTTGEDWPLADTSSRHSTQSGSFSLDDEQAEICEAIAIHYEHHQHASEIIIRRDKRNSGWEPKDCGYDNDSDRPAPLSAEEPGVQSYRHHGA